MKRFREARARCRKRGCTRTDTALVSGLVTEERLCPVHLREFEAYFRRYMRDRLGKEMRRK